MPRSIKIGLNQLPWVLTPAASTSRYRYSGPPWRDRYDTLPRNSGGSTSWPERCGIQPAACRIRFRAGARLLLRQLSHRDSRRHRGGREHDTPRCGPTSATPRSSSPPVSLRNGWRTSRWCRRKRGDPSPRHRRAGCGCCAITSEESPRRCILMSATPSKSSPRCTRFSTPSRRLTCHSGQILHLAWAGMTPSKIMADYADRIVAMHPQGRTPRSS